MALNLTVLGGHLSRAFSDFPMSVYWQGKAIPCVRSQPNMSQTLEVGGPDEKVEFDLFLRSSDLPRTPREGDLFVVNKITMKVISVRNAAETGELIACGMGYARDGSY